VRAALMWVGLKDPVDTQESLRKGDPKLTKLIRVATVWRDALGFSPECATTAQAVAKAQEKKTSPEGWVSLKPELANPDLFETLIGLGRRGGEINPDAVGNYIRSELDRVVVLETGERVRFEVLGERSGAKIWGLVLIDGKPGGGPKREDQTVDDEVPF
jgi:hypothetical protein